MDIPVRTCQAIIGVYSIMHAPAIARNPILLGKRLSAPTITILFIFLWLLRKKINLPFIMFGVYLMLNGLERFVIEKMRVNNPYTFIGIRATQAQWIALSLVIGGAALIIYSTFFHRNTKPVKLSDVV